MVAVSSILSASQRAQLASLLTFGDSTTLGAGRDAYDLLFEWISLPDGSGPVSSVDHNV